VKHCLTILALFLSAFSFSLSIYGLEAGPVKRATDKAGNWIVEQYDTKGRVFGKTPDSTDIITTALVIKALCDSPRDYKEANGPFITEPVKFLLEQLNEDGTFKDASKNGTEAVAWVRSALESTHNEKYKPLTEKLKALKGGDTPLTAGIQPKYRLWIEEFAKVKEKADAEAFAEKMLALQQKDGSFDQNVHATAVALQSLTYAYKKMK